MRRRMSVAVSVIAVAVLGIGVAGAEFNIGFWGLAHSFPIVYFIGLGLLAVASAMLWRSERSEWKLLLPQTALMVVGLWLVPSLVGHPPGQPMAYRNLFDINGIAEYGLGYALNNPDTYLSWMGFQAFFAGVERTFTVNLEAVFRIYPFIVQVLCLILLYVFLRNTLGRNNSNWCWGGLWLFSVANWVGQDYFCPQSFGILLLLSFLALVTVPAFREDKGKWRWAVWVALVVVVGLTATVHLLTSLVLILFLVALCVVFREKRAFAMAGVCMALVLAWNLTVGGVYFDIKRTQASRAPTGMVSRGSGADSVDSVSRVEGRGLFTFSPSYIVRSNILGSLSGSDSHRAVSLVRLGQSSAFLLLGAGAGLLALFKRRSRAVVLFILMPASLLCLYPIKAAGWELSQRLYIFGLPFMAYFAMSLLHHKTKLVSVALCGLLAVSIPLFFVSRYGNQAVDYLSDNYIEGLREVNELAEVTDYRFMWWVAVGWADGQPDFGEYAARGQHYFVISDHDDAVFTFTHGIPDLVDNIWGWLEEGYHPELFCEYEKVYENDEFAIYKGFRGLDGKMYNEWVSGGRMW